MLHVYVRYLYCRINVITEFIMTNSSVTSIQFENGDRYCERRLKPNKVNKYM